MNLLTIANTFIYKKLPEPSTTWLDHAPRNSRSKVPYPSLESYFGSRAQKDPVNIAKKRKAARKASRKARKINRKKR